MMNDTRRTKNALLKALLWTCVLLVYVTVLHVTGNSANLLLVTLAGLIAVLMTQSWNTVQGKPWRALQ